MKVLFGNSRRLFANHFYVKADVTFHSGYYPSIFDQARRAEEESHMAAEQHASAAHEQEGHDHEEHDHEGPAASAAGPDDWIARFGRRFRVTEHTELEGEKVREILPWLRISAELDPHRVETYTVAAYWLRSRLGKIDEAEQFLREGLRANPGSHEILYELGCLCQDEHHDAARARNIWQLALRRWHEKEDTEKEPDFKAFGKITDHLADLEEKEGNLAEAIKWLEVAKTHSPNPDALQQHVETLRAKLAESSNRH